MSLIGGKWKLLILRNLKTCPWRFNELQRDLEGISPKVLTDSLRQMIDDSLASYCRTLIEKELSWHLSVVALISAIAL